MGTTETTPLATEATREGVLLLPSNPNVMINHDATAQSKHCPVSQLQDPCEAKVMIKSAARPMRLLENIAPSNVNKDDQPPHKKQHTIGNVARRSEVPSQKIFGSSGARTPLGTINMNVI